MAIFSLWPHFLPLPFLLYLYRTVESSQCFLLALCFQPLQLILFGFQDSGHVLLPVRSIPFFSNTPSLFNTVLCAFYGSCLITSGAFQLSGKHLQLLLALAPPGKLTYKRHWLKAFQKKWIDGCWRTYCSRCSESRISVKLVISGMHTWQDCVKSQDFVLWTIRSDWGFCRGILT